MDRRTFNRLCTGLVAGAATLHATADGVKTPYPRSQLTFADDTPVTLDALPAGKAFIFSYPYVTTPCFLMRLAREAPATSGWSGGIGPDQDVVAFSAICTHKMSHPARPISHINYRHDTVQYRDQEGELRTGKGLISCCSERSVYDPALAGRAIAGPAPLPLAAIALASSERGELAAVGSQGSDQYERFLEQFGFRLAMEYGTSDVRARAGDTTVVTPANEFSQQQIRC